MGLAQSPHIANRFLSLLVHVASSGHPDPFWVQVWGGSGVDLAPKDNHKTGAHVEHDSGGGTGVRWGKFLEDKPKTSECLGHPIRLGRCPNKKP